LFIGFATKLSEEFSRKVIMTWFLVTPFALVGSRVFARLIVHGMVVRGSGAGSMIIVGANALGFRLAKKVIDDQYI
jgi:putative colanic acid biosysnthesis UDP-glucose lipid carrier transferase